MFGYGSAPLNEGLGKLVFFYRNPEDDVRMSESKQTAQKLHFQKAAMATSPTRNC